MASAAKNSEGTGKIVQAAGQLFARQGYHGTSTREIAHLADISENTLFRYFEHKEDLFWSALEASFSEVRLRKDLLNDMAECEAPEIVLPQVLALLVETVTFKPQLLCLIAVALIELRWKAKTICQQHLSPAFAAFTHYLARNIETGRIRNLEPRMITSALAMTVIVHPDLSRLISGVLPPHSDSRDAVRAYTKFWLDILTPQSINRSREAMEITETSNVLILSRSVALFRFIAVTRKGNGVTCNLRVKEQSFAGLADSSADIWSTAFLLAVQM